MGNVVIKAEDIGKLYKLGEIGTGTLSHDLNRWWARVRGKEDPFAKIGQTNDRTQKGSSDYVWALKDINFEVRRGEVLGIIGRNGAGKSTLLKILSKVTTPSTGRIKVKGRIASLLEVGTGFHPELTGRENIFLNGAILGMTKAEIRSKFDEIVDFAGVERYIDTPVKRYSSGMYVRLAFAVAAFLEPEILIVDEVLAVGDAEFQKKCIGRMKDVSINDGRTVLFVSHNMTAIRELTQYCLFLKNGKINSYGYTNEIVTNYMSSYVEDFSRLVYEINDENIVRLPHLLNEITIESVAIKNRENNHIITGENIEFELKIKGNNFKDYYNKVIGTRIMSVEDIPVGTFFSPPFVNVKKDEEIKVRFVYENVRLAPGRYYFTIWLGDGDYRTYGKDYFSVDRVCYIDVSLDSKGDVTPVWYNNSWGSVVFESSKNL